MKSFISGKKTWIWLTVLLLLFIGIIYFVTPKKPEEYPDYVADSPSPTGVKAFYTYLKNENNHVQRWTHNPGLLPKEEKQQLLIMSGPSIIPEQDVLQDYISFMEAGNTILLLKANPEGMFDVTTEPIMGEDVDTTLYDDNEISYQAVNNDAVRITPDVDDNVLLEDDHGTIAMKKDYQDGALITAVSPDWIMNDKIAEKDHVDLLFSLIEEENHDWDSVYFDDYMHGSENASSINTLYPKWFLITGFQAILLIIMLLWYRGKRFGRVIVPREEMVRFSNERIRALAAWYRRGHLYDDSFRHQVEYVRFLMQEQWGIAYHKDWEDIAPQLERRVKSIAGEDVLTFLNGLQRVLEKKNMNKQEYLLWSKRIDTLQKEVEEA